MRFLLGNGCGSGFCLKILEDTAEIRFYVVQSCYASMHSEKKLLVIVNCVKLSLARGAVTPSQPNPKTILPCCPRCHMYPVPHCFFFWSNGNILLNNN